MGNYPVRFEGPGMIRVMDRIIPVPELLPGCSGDTSAVDEFTVFEEDGVKVVHLVHWGYHESVVADSLEVHVDPGVLAAWEAQA